MQTQTTTLVERVLAHVKLFEGYSTAYYCEAMGITRDQFHSVAKRYLRKYGPRSYTTWYLKNSAKYPQS